MRKTSPLLAPLFTPTMQQVLAATVLRPERAWYLSDLAAHLGLRPSSLQRPVAGLARAGILSREQQGNRVYYRADPACPILAELAGILTKTVGIADPLRAALEPLARRIRVAFIHGSIATATERSGSDVDLIIVGSATNAEIAVAVRPVQEQLGREVRFTRYTAQELSGKAAAGHPFVTSVLQRPVIFLLGGKEELAEIVGRPPRGG